MITHNENDWFLRNRRNESWKLNISGYMQCINYKKDMRTVIILQAGPSKFWFLAGHKVFLLDNLSSSGAHSASYSMGTGGSFLRGTAAGAWIWPLTSIVWGSKMGSYTSTLPKFLQGVDKNNSTLSIIGEKTSLKIQWKAFRNRWKYEHIQTPHD